MKTCHGCGRLNLETAASCAECAHALPAASPPVLPDSPASRGDALAPAVTPPLVEPLLALTGNNGFDEEAWRAVIGPKAQDHYLQRFREMAAAGGTFQVNWHWPSLFHTGLWLLYRKAWLAAVLYMVLIYALSSAVEWVSMVTDVGGILAVGFALLATLAVPPLSAHWIYFRKCRSLVDNTVPGESRQQHLERLARQGGTTWTAVIAVVGLYVLALVYLLVLLWFLRG